MYRRVLLACSLATLMVSGAANADIIAVYEFDAGGNNGDPLNGLKAQASFSIVGQTLTILLENVSSNVPVGFDVSDSLLVSLGMNLPDGVEIASGDSAVIGPDSAGVGSWSDRDPGDSVAEQWLWTNNSGGDLLASYGNVISTSEGTGGGEEFRFDGADGTIAGPFGGIVADPVIIAMPGSAEAVSDSIRFTLLLTGTLSDEQLQQIVDGSIVEYGSDEQYLTVPEPTTIALLVMGGFLMLRARTFAAP